MSLPAPSFIVIVGLLLGGATLVARADEISDAERLLKKGQTTAALARIDAYLASGPRQPQGAFLKGVILVDLGRDDEALAVFTKLVEDFPELSEPYNNLAVLYARQGEYEKARRALDMAIRTNPDYALARENLGDVYARLASQSYGQALKLDPGNRAMQAKLARYREGGSVVATGGTPAPLAAVSPAGPAATPAGTGTARQAGRPAATPVPVARPPVEPAASAAAPAAPGKVAEAPPGVAAEGVAPSGGTAQREIASAGEQREMLREPDRGVAAGGWDVRFSPYTVHYHPSDEHKWVVLLGAEKGLGGNWLAGGVVFSNSFGQPSVYVYGGQRFVNPFGFENWYVQWTAGLLYGYVGEYEDKVPFNHNGFSPGFIPLIGYQFNKYVYGELGFLGTAGLMFSAVFPLPTN